MNALGRYVELEATKISIEQFEFPFILEKHNGQALIFSFRIYLQQSVSKQR